MPLPMHGGVVLEGAGDVESQHSGCLTTIALANRSKYGFDTTRTVLR